MTTAKKEISTAAVLKAHEALLADHNNLVASHNELVDQVAELIRTIEDMKTAKASGSVRNRGPASTREMTEADAEIIMLGDMADKSHRECAEVLGLSYGQIYSARNGYTFKGVYAKAHKK